MHERRTLLRALKSLLDCDKIFVGFSSKIEKNDSSI